MAKRASVVFAVKWVAVPLVLAAIGFFGLGPLLENRATAAEMKASSKALEEPRRFSTEPDVDVSVAPAPRRSAERTRTAPTRRAPTPPREEAPPPSDAEPPKAEPTDDHGAPPPDDGIGTTVPDIVPPDGDVGEPPLPGDGGSNEETPPADERGRGSGGSSPFPLRTTLFEGEGRPLP